MAVKIAALSDKGKDPADIIAKSPAEFADGLKNSTHFVKFLLERAAARGETVRERSRLVRAEVLPFVRDVKSAIERAEFVKDIAARLEVREDAVWEDLEKIESSQLPTTNYQLPTNKAQNSALRMLTGIIFWQEKLTENERKIDTEKLRKALGAIGAEFLLYISAISADERDTHIFEAEARFGGGEEIPKEVSVLLLHLEKEELERKSVEILNALTVAERGGESEARRKELLTLLQSIRMRIEEIKRLLAE